MISRSGASFRLYSSHPSSSWTRSIVSLNAAMTASRCSGTGTIVATTTTDMSSPSACEDRAQRGRDVMVGPDTTQPAPARARQVARQIRVLLAGGVEQYVQPRQAGRERAGVRAGVVHAIGQQQHPRVQGGNDR